MGGSIRWGVYTVGGGGSIRWVVLYGGGLYGGWVYTGGLFGGGSIRVGGSIRWGVYLVGILYGMRSIGGVYCFFFLSGILV